MSSIATDKATRKRARALRLGGLLAVLAISTAIGLLHGAKGVAWRPVSVDALCPFGGIETLWAFIAGGFLIKKIALSSLILLVGVVATALLMGRSFCGQVCPLGTLQELSARTGRKLFGRRLVLPKILDRPARYLKYAVLLGFTLWTWAVSDLVIRAYDPWVAYHHLTSPELLTELGVGLFVLLVALLGSLVYDRFFCKYACPMGAFLGIFTRLSMFRITRDTDACVDCGLCDRACPVNLPVATQQITNSSECIACSECVTACPAPGALSIASRSGRAITAQKLTVLTLAIFFGIALLSTALGWFDLQQPTLASEINRAAKQGVPVDTNSIKGSATMREVSDASGIPAADLQSAFGVTEAEMDLPLKEVKNVHGFSMEDVRGYVAARLDQP
ncbi:MAG: 4Fe-4S binding protein [Actinobacteria bacterium]|nr:4Fe-4S binding protein [Actinomycetota bacterium]MCG2808084.1 4Fe-4S binding protein [Coriobacteriia bacterium]